MFTNNISRDDIAYVYLMFALTNYVKMFASEVSSVTHVTLLS